MVKEASHLLHKGALFVISAPSGAGKSTLCRALLKKIPNMKLSVSFTTRTPRRGEKNDVHYTFITEGKFKRMIERGEFAEWAMVHNNLYGTSMKRLRKLQREGYDIILDIDTRGALQLKKSCSDAVFIFIVPPSLRVLKERLLKRRTESKDAIAERLRNAKGEISHVDNYDFIVVNDSIRKAYRDIESIVIATKLKREYVDKKWIKRLIT